MIKHSSRLSVICLVCTVILTACAHSGDGSEKLASMNRGFESDDELIWAADKLAYTDFTRLHPHYVYETLVNRGSNPEIQRAFESAKQQGGEQAVRDLIIALEDEFIRNPDTSALDLLGPELSDHFRDFEWDENDFPGGPDGPNETLADVMVDALDEMRPERRANSKRYAVVLRDEATEDVWEYMTNQWKPVPNQGDWMLNRHAVDSFVRMSEAAKEDGVDLVIKSGHRLRSTAERNAARTGNPNAVASFSSHSLGLAVDFQMSQDNFQLAEVTTRPMSEVVRMRQSPVHKWLMLRGDDFGWYPYQNEPWHWEYNPEGFRDTFWADYPGGAPKRDLKVYQ